MEEKILLKLAKDSIYEGLTKNKLIDKNQYKNKELYQHRATFVTINKDGHLRGCIGSLLPQRDLIDDIIYNAKAAAFKDPRFPPLTIDEFNDIEIEISLLSIPTLLEYKDIDDLKSKLKVGIDGVILKQNNHQATFLPSVWEQLPTFELFFEHLCAKANLNTNCLENHPQIYIYQAKKIK